MNMSKKRARSLLAAPAARPLLAAVALGIASHTAAQAASPDEDVAITIYSSAQPGAISPEYYRPLPGQGTPPAMGVPGYAMVRQERPVQLTAGRSQLRFTDVAALIDPTTVTFTSLTDPSTRVLEQNFQFDLVSTDKLLLKYIDRPITVERSIAGGGTVSTTGTLLSYSQAPAPATSMVAVKVTTAPAPSSAGDTSSTVKPAEDAPTPSAQSWWAAAKPAGGPVTKREARAQSKEVQAPR